MNESLFPKYIEGEPKSMSEFRTDIDTIRPVGQLDLVAEFRNLMLNVGLHHAINEHYDTDPLIIFLSDKPTHVQRFYLNVYINRQIVMTKEDAFEERYCLVPDGDFNIWLDIINKKIIPFFLTYNLPIKT